MQKITPQELINRLARKLGVDPYVSRRGVPMISYKTPGLHFLNICFFGKSQKWRVFTNAWFTSSSDSDKQERIDFSTEEDVLSFVRNYDQNNTTRTN